MTATQPTPFSDVNAFLQQFLSHVRAILGSDFVGLYLYGSLALGDFDPASSDVDAVVATATPLRGVVTLTSARHVMWGIRPHFWPEMHAQWQETGRKPASSGE